MYGIFSYGITLPRIGWKQGNRILDLEVVGLLGYFSDLNIDPAVFAQPVLNDFIALGKPTHQAIRQRIIDLLADKAGVLKSVHEQVFIHESRAQMHLPVRVGDYTDFYAGIHHAENVGRMFRPDGDPLLPNYKQLPVAYHGRASSIVVSGTPIRRPNGQFLGSDKQPVFGPSQALDFELELGLIIGKSIPLGEPISVHEAEEYIFGVTLFNDWSARDIQRWEYQPLGPFLGKNFASSLSAWVLPFDELEPFRIAGLHQEPTPLSYLQTAKPRHFTIELEVWLKPADGEEICIARTNAKYLYWNFAQMIAHHTVGGCNLNIGDVLATGTISGLEPGSYGSLLELSWNGTRPLHLSHTEARTFLANGDTITLRGWGFLNGIRVDLGEVSGSIQPALQL
ncbi:fumarylacetoacetase [Spirosoma validum]|uniref:fumarylacetoacetase n=1 Tax=Spirosoma validum TaxID=2771355 RepID=A0A927B6W2_9BACT|nr:fumarylacetoacetase [Spirosoma validum]MBD2756388.1 fumarylacetoacetase [Spirosoma validum]